MSEHKSEVIHTEIWEEEPEADNPFAAARCFCSGYDVYGEILGKASWFEYLFLLFKRERPTRKQAQLLEGLAIALANPGPRDHSVRAAMNAGVGGSGAASALMAALAVGAGGYGGAHEVALAMEGWEACGLDLESWRKRLKKLPEQTRADVWPEMEHQPGFDPHGASCPTPIRQTLAHLAQLSPDPSALSWLLAHRSSLEQVVGYPLAMTGVAAAALHDLKLEARAGEALFLMLRLPGAAVHALEQRDYGWRRYPFFRDGLSLTDDPGLPAGDA